MLENLQNIHIQRLNSFSDKNVQTDLLRIDLLHPIISGNKWFKLQFYLQEALELGKTGIATFGGAYSNHIVATAYAAESLGLKSIGLIRGDKPKTPSPTLMDAARYGMELVYIDRVSYQNKEALQQKWNDGSLYWIMEGGYGAKGAAGAATILSTADTTHYTHIVCAVGTGTMMAGLVNGAIAGQQVIGVSVLKNNTGLEKEVAQLVNRVNEHANFSLLHDYHFGGYAKQTPALYDFMKELWEAERVPTDIVYTSKLLYGMKDLLSKDYFEPGSQVLVVHSGGLQGNRSVRAGRLPF